MYHALQAHVVLSPFRFVMQGIFRIVDQNQSDPVSNGLLDSQKELSVADNLSSNSSFLKNRPNSHCGIYKHGDSFASNIKNQSLNADLIQKKPAPSRNTIVGAMSDFFSNVFGGNSQNQHRSSENARYSIDRSSSRPHSTSSIPVKNLPIQPVKGTTFIPCPPNTPTPVEMLQKGLIIVGHTPDGYAVFKQANLSSSVSVQKTPVVTNPIVQNDLVPNNRVNGLESCGLPSRAAVHVSIMGQSSSIKPIPTRAPPTIHSLGSSPHLSHLPKAPCLKMVAHNPISYVDNITSQQEENGKNRTCAFRDVSLSQIPIHELDVKATAVIDPNCSNSSCNSSTPSPTSSESVNYDALTSSIEFHIENFDSKVENSNILIKSGTNNGDQENYSENQVHNIISNCTDDIPAVDDEKTFDERPISILKSMPPLKSISGVHHVQSKPILSHDQQRGCHRTNFGPVNDQLPNNGTSNLQSSPLNEASKRSVNCLEQVETSSSSLAYTLNDLSIKPPIPPPPAATFNKDSSCVSSDIPDAIPKVVNRNITRNVLGISNSSEIKTPVADRNVGKHYHPAPLTAALSNGFSTMAPTSSACSTSMTISAAASRRSTSIDVENDAPIFASKQVSSSLLVSSSTLGLQPIYESRSSSSSTSPKENPAPSQQIFKHPALPAVGQNPGSPLNRNCEMKKDFSVITNMCAIKEETVTNSRVPSKFTEEFQRDAADVFPDKQQSKGIHERVFHNHEYALLDKNTESHTIKSKVVHRMMRVENSPSALSPSNTQQIHETNKKSDFTSPSEGLKEAFEVAKSANIVNEAPDSTKSENTRQHIQVPAPVLSNLVASTPPPPMTFSSTLGVIFPPSSPSSLHFYGRLFLDCPSSLRLDYTTVKGIKKIAGGGYGEVWEGSLTTTQGPYRVAYKQSIAAARAAANSKPKSTSVNSRDAKLCANDAIRISSVNGLCEDKESMIEEPSQDAIKAFQYEIRALAALRGHELIVKMIGVSPCPRRLLVVQELLAGGTLMSAAWPGVGNALQRLAWANQVCEVVSFVHSRGFLHRDIKSDNFVFSNSDRMKIKLIDFGRARHTGAALEHPLRGDTGGCPRYMPPETFKGHNIVSDRSDVWPLACCVIEIFGGPLPYENENDSGRIQRYIVAYGLTPLVPVNFPTRLADILFQCFAYEASRRPTANQLLKVVKSISLEEVKRHRMDSFAMPRPFERMLHGPTNMMKKMSSGVATAITPTPAVSSAKPFVISTEKEMVQGQTLTCSNPSYSSVVSSLNNSNLKANNDIQQEQKLRPVSSSISSRQNMVHFQENLHQQQQRILQGQASNPQLQQHYHGISRMTTAFEVASSSRVSHLPQHNNNASSSRNLFNNAVSSSHQDSQRITYQNLQQHQSKTSTNAFSVLQNPPPHLLQQNRNHVVQGRVSRSSFSYIPSSSSGFAAQKNPLHHQVSVSRQIGQVNATVLMDEIQDSSNGSIQIQRNDFQCQKAALTTNVADSVLESNSLASKKYEPPSRKTDLAVYNTPSVVPAISYCGTRHISDKGKNSQSSLHYGVNKPTKPQNSINGISRLTVSIHGDRQLL